jgi:hypothetical protein
MEDLMNKKKGTYIIIITTICTLSVVTLFSQQVSGPYEFPIKPGSEEWKAFTTINQMVEACQIPQSLLRSMTTADLLETCLEYPIYIDLLAFDNKQRGFEHITAGFNGLQELLKRNDVGTAAVEKYRTLDPDAVDDATKWHYSKQFFYLEILLAQDTVITKLSKNERIQLLNEAHNKFLMKGRHQDKFSPIVFTSNALLMGRIMVKDNYMPFVQEISQNKRLKKGLLDASLNHKDDIIQIIRHAEQRLGIN